MKRPRNPTEQEKKDLADAVWIGRRNARAVEEVRECHRLLDHFGVRANQARTVHRLSLKARIRLLAKQKGGAL